ncbi:hypothetical protein [Photobacterium kishitanii]|uniref:Uncharacterized protein n=1 Tax=Photobacterium kishitanii TaxID=318456 RepID=A0A2T3KM79_9GAMM|nr:hypothetical protein [Photobacterium kishitanii]PSV00882.1 hypothetical protein C9J27_02315 [Photobacterium kishitanii]
MDDELLGPMADALSATLAVFILLISFFAMAQLQAISKQIKIERAGTGKYFQHEVVVDFSKPHIAEDKLVFFKSFDAYRSSDLIDRYIGQEILKQKIVAGDTVVISSNYPIINVGEGESTKRGVINALKIATVLKNKKIKYDINITNNVNFYYVGINKK